jgi:subtilisin family serine protease
VPAALAVVLVTAAAALGAWLTGGSGKQAPPSTVVVGFRSLPALHAALDRHHARVVRLLPSLRAAEVAPGDEPAAFAAAVTRQPGISYAEPPAPRASTAEPATALPQTAPLEWQYAATHVPEVPAAVQQAAKAVTIAVIDTGTDVTAPDLAAKSPVTWSVVGGSAQVRDTVGHGTFVAALAAGSATNGDGIAGFGGDARLIVVQASGSDGSFSDVDEAAAIVWAVDHGAKILNLSMGGTDTSSTERDAIDYAVAHGALVVAAVGNEYADGNPVEYPAALLQPVGSNGRGGVGLSVGASDRSGRRASFSNTGSQLSLVAPGTDVFSALSSTARNGAYVRIALPGSTAGLYGSGSGTSFAAPQVAGAAALVWAANPSLTAPQVAEAIKQGASGGGSWNPETGFGVLDVARAVELASTATFAAAAAPTQAAVPATLRAQAVSRSRIKLSWQGQGAGYRIAVRENGGPTRIAVPTTARTATTLPGKAGSRYEFTLEVLDAAGAVVSRSAPARVALPAARSPQLRAKPY